MKEIKYKWIKWLGEQQYTHAVTLKPNFTNIKISDNFLFRLFTKFHMLVQRRLFGTRFNNANKRIFHTPAVAILEGSTDTAHIHAAFKVQEGNWAAFETLFVEGGAKASRQGPWRTLVQNGTCQVDQITECSGWHNYQLKEAWSNDVGDRMIFLPLSA
ncbi:MAG: hypothetical protein WAT93_12525 [Pontixanthobacter sp.]